MGYDEMSKNKPALEVNETVFQQQVIELAHLYGWKVAHFRAAKTGRTYLNKKGEVKPVYVTPVQADGVGFPDLVLAKYGKVIFAEVKSENGRLSPEQRGWLDILASSSCPTYCWRPSDWNEIEGVLESSPVQY